MARNLYASTASADSLVKVMGDCVEAIGRFDKLVAGMLEGRRRYRTLDALPLGKVANAYSGTGVS